MKKIAVLSIVIVSIMMIGTSCKKYPTNYMHPGDIAPRAVQFVLSTDRGFSNETNLVTFKLSIQRSTGETIWDSVLAPIKLKDIPTLAEPLFVEKYVPGNDPSLLKVGFYYSIDNVGNSSFLEPFEAGETLKIVSFNFH